MYMCLTFFLQTLHLDLVTVIDARHALDREEQKVRQHWVHALKVELQTRM